MKSKVSLEVARSQYLKISISKDLFDSREIKFKYHDDLLFFIIDNEHEKLYISKVFESEIFK